MTTIVAARPARQRLESLDAIRGVCAILVMLMHSRFLTGFDPFPSAYLPVDLFFMMSGYVIGYAYDAKLRAGDYVAMFVARRYARLLPMWTIGLTIAFAFPVAMSLHVNRSLDPLFDYAPTLVLLPSARAHELFPGNSPGWSLFFELIANFAYALCVRHLTPRRLVAIILASFCWLAILGFRNGGLDGGAEWPTAWMGLARVSFGFSFGLLMYRLPRLPTSRRWDGVFLLALVALPLLLAVDPRPSLRPAYDLAVAGVALPLLLLLGLVTEVRWPRTAEALGMLSYPLYAVHFGIMMAIYCVEGLVRGFPVRPVGGTEAVLIVAGILLVAYGLGRYVDPAAQRMAGRLLHRRPVQLPDPEVVAS